MSALSNVELEADILGVMLTTNSAIDSIADVVSIDDFSIGLHQRIFEVTVREAALGKRVTPVTIKGFFEGDADLQAVGGNAYLARLSTSMTLAIDAADTAKHLREIARRRRMMASLATASEACGDLSVPIHEIVEHADGAISETARDTVHQPTGGECFDELLASFVDRVPGVTCGNIPALDALLGSMRPKQLIIGAGRPGMGKTALALSYALGAAMRGHGVLFVSLEMSSTELAARMAADLCFDGSQGVPYNFIRDGDLNDWQMRRVQESAAFMRTLPFQVVDAGSLTIGRLNMLIRRHTRRMAAMGFSLDLVVVDYLQLLHPDNKGRSTYEAVSEVSRGLKAMAKDHGVAVFALAQLSRSVESRPDKRPMLSDLRDSGQIEQDADAVLFLLRQEYYIKQDEPDPLDPKHGEWRAKMEAAKGLIEFIVAKRRNGETGSNFGAFHGNYQAVRGLSQ